MTGKCEVIREDRCPALLLHLALAGMVLTFLAAGGSEVPAQEGPRQQASSEEEADDTASARVAKEKPEDASYFETVTVTATGSQIDSFEVPTPVTVIRAEEIERRPVNNASDLLRDHPGVDVNGVGSNQPRPIIRGLRGLRVLFMENGLRMNNPRRQTDFGEITGLVDLDGVSSVEVVRGPASVLYGSDAIGGVLNVVSRPPALPEDGSLGGSFGVRYGTADEQVRTTVRLNGGASRFIFDVGLTYRDSEDYDAPEGSFGDIRLFEDTRVTDTGVQDESIYGALTYRVADDHDLTLRFNRYRADRTGFGFVEPDLFGQPDDFRIRITYPFQDFDRYTLAYRGRNLGSTVADSVETQAYFQSNERELSNDIDINIGPIGPGFPDSSVEADTLNFTDLDTVGVRSEFLKAVAGKHLFTYGFEYTRDDSFNTDTSTTTTTLRFSGPPFEVVDVETDEIPNAPNATNTGYGIFVQDEIEVARALKLTAGARYQEVKTEAEPTEGWDISGLDFSDDNLVGSIGLLYRVSDSVHLVASYGTAFRTPNIIERLFNGPTPEGVGFQVLNPDLKSEEGENKELGVKYRRDNVYFELIAFRNDIDDGIIQAFLTQEEIDQLPQEIRDQIDQLNVDVVVQQRNVDRLRYEGLEVSLGYQFPFGLTLTGNYTYLDGERLGQTPVPVEESFSDKANLVVRYEPAGQPYWLEYRLRHNGDQDTAVAPGEPVPAVGEVLPSFTVHSLAGGVELSRRGGLRHEIGLAIVNLTDELFAEFSNASFFRPQPKRNFVASYRIRF